LEERGRAADKSFPDNRYLRFEKGEPILTPVQAAPDPDGLDQSLALIKERMEPIEILDAFADTEYWLNWTRHFGPISGLESKLKQLVTGICSQSSVTAAIWAGANCSLGAWSQPLPGCLHQSASHHRAFLE
jgi:hypothetical protein